MHVRHAVIRRVLAVALTVAVSAGWSVAQDVAAAKPAAAPEAIAEAGFVSLFNGKDLAGWDGDPRLWSVKDGVIRGQTTEQNKANGNTFCVWRGGKIENFILKIKFRIAGGNSGVQYRSKEVDKWRISGYQAEVCNGGSVGFLYHERGRGSLVRVGDFGQIDVVDGKAVKETVGKVSDRKALAKAGYYKPNDWNEYTIIAQGNFLRHYLNGYPTVALIDNDRTTDPTDAKDTKGAAAEGVLALQIHAGPPMVVEFKDIRLKPLKADYGRAVRLFNGKDLTGWTLSSDALKETFGVAGGVLTDTGRPAGYLRTEKDHTNYALHLQMRHIKKGNSGVLVRAVGPDKVWPKSIEAQGQSGSMGDIWNIDRFPMKATADRTRGRHTRKAHPSNERAIGEWNDYEIGLAGGDLEIRVNNLIQNTATDCEEVAGKICLQAEGSPKEFRNIVLVPIGGGAGGDVFADSFDGKPGAGWSWLREDPKTWRIKDGGLEIMIPTGAATTVKNALVRKAPDRGKGTCAIDVTVTSLTMPTRQYEQAGITWYSNGRPVFKLVKELIDGKLYIIPGQKPMSAKTVQLRLIASATGWTAQYRPDGEGEFLTAGKGKLPAPGKDEVSIQCYNGPTDAEHWIRFDDFRIRKLGD
jgi:hypothetical protein